MSHKWIDGGYKEGDEITTVDGLTCVLKTSLSYLGWVATDLSTGRDTIVMFCNENLEAK